MMQTVSRSNIPNKPKGDEQRLNEPPKDILKLSFPNDYAKPIGIDLGQGKSFTLADQSAVRGYRSELIDSTLNQKQDPALDAFTKKRVDEMKKQAEKDNSQTQDVLSYRSPDNRKTILYSYRADQAQGAKKLKSWTIYAKGNGTEKESYLLNGATAKINDAGDLDVFLVSQQDVQNESVKAQVDPSLLERARKTLEKESAGNINDNRAPDLSIPKPYFVDKDGNHHGADWVVSDDGKAFSVSISDAAGLYPIALDPTLSFTAPGMGNSGTAITGSAGENFSSAMTTGDFNSDGRMDLASSCGNSKICIYYNDGLYASNSTGADVVISGNSYITGAVYALVAGDFNSDGRTDLAYGDEFWSASGRVSIISQGVGGVWPSDADTAEATITNGVVNGSNGGEWFGTQLVSGDFNADGKTDLVVGSYGYPEGAGSGRAYVYYQDGAWPSASTGADAIMTGTTAGDRFGGGYEFGTAHYLAAGDFNADGKADLAVGAPGDYTDTLDGYAYVFYGGSITTENASGADVVLSGATAEEFGSSVAMGDFNSDGKTDLAVGASGYSSGTGQVYIFYGGSVVTEDSSGADVSIAGDGENFGTTLAAGDFDADGWGDLAVASYANYAKGMVYLFRGDGSIPVSAATADVNITGENNSDYFGITLVPGDFNADGKTDFAVGAQQYVTDNGGRVYIFYNDGSYPSLAVNADVKMTGETSVDIFGAGFNGADALGAGDFNGDGKTDLVAGSAFHNAGHGRVYIFYNDGSYPSSATSADVKIDSTSTAMFGEQFASGDFNADGKTDLAACGFYNTRIFYNDWSYPADESQADFSIPDTTYGYTTLVAGDFNGDGKTDLVMGYAGDDYVSFVSMDAKTVSADPVLLRGPVKVRGPVRVR
ncbi:MAG: hypothetical protein HGA31_04280 [Candidatus Moranbacteria bacterium]|nr:hypothetical protein [Candidatus Moranbacteria bacterium]